ncbi:MAG: LytTR family transcriptional regulator, partial [Flavobacteriaceae bacterium]|nr:LytTR family transcriptional regulator [Flavobacteriaceae bacterium]
FNHTIEKNNEFIANIYSIKLSEPSLNGTIFTSGPSGYSAINKKKYTPFPYRVQDVSIWKKDTLVATPFGVFKKLNDSIIALSKESELLGYRSDDIDVSKNGDYFFIATHGAGVVVYGKGTYNISIKDGLTSNIINEIHVENDSTIWACTNKGLNRIVFNDKGFSVTNIDKDSGLLSNGVEDVEIINEILWVGTKDGLCYMPKQLLDNKKSDNIYFKLKEISANDVVYGNDDSPKLNYKENKITFLVEGISFAENNNLHYQFRLKETGSTWSTTKNRSISFPNLSHGKYTFQVNPCIGSKCYTEKQLEYTFTILPPFWKTGWFYIGCFLALGGIVYAFFKIRVLTYNKDVTREFIRLLIKRLKRDEKYLEIRMNGERIKISTNEILYIKSSGNYLDIIYSDKTYTIRCKIGDFITTTPDALEYLRLHRSYIIRIDQVTGKSKNSVTINEHIIPVGETYLKQLDKIQF